MKGVMIKVGQFLSARIDFLPEEYTSELSRLQDQVPPHDYTEIRQQMIAELGAPPEQIFSVFDPVPIAAASLGQVHRAVLSDGREVAVKVQYPGIVGVIETDIRMFRTLIRVMRLTMRRRLGRINLELLHEEFSRIVRAELDYIQEAKSAERFRDNFIDDDRVVIPAVVWECTKGRVLTLEFVRGIKITETAAIGEEGIDCTQTVNLLAETYSKMIFLHGFFHGDPHPGNIFVSPGPKLVLVDFGMVQAIPAEISRELRRFAYAIVERDADEVIRSMERMGFIIEGADFGALAGVAGEMIEKYRDITPTGLKSLTVEEVGAEIEKIIGVARYIQIPNNFILLGRTIGILNGLAFTLNPEINIIEIGKPYIKEFLRGGREERRKEFAKSVKDFGAGLWQLPSAINDLLRKADRGELSFRLARSEMEEITGKFRTMTNVMMLVVLTVTAAAASLFCVLIGSPALALTAAAASVILGILSVIRLMKD